MTFEDRWLSLKQLADYSSLSLSTLKRLVRLPHGALPARKVGGRVVVKRSEFDHWMEERDRTRNAAAAQEARELGLL